MTKEDAQIIDWLDFALEYHLYQFTGFYWRPSHKAFICHGCARLKNWTRDRRPATYRKGICGWCNGENQMDPVIIYISFCTTPERSAIFDYE